MFVAERFVPGLVKIRGKHPLSTDGGTRYPRSTYRDRPYPIKIKIFLFLNLSDIEPAIIPKM